MRYLLVLLVVLWPSLGQACETVHVPEHPSIVMYAPACGTEIQSPFQVSIVALPAIKPQTVRVQIWKLGQSGETKLLKTYPGEDVIATIELGETIGVDEFQARLARAPMADLPPGKYLILAYQGARLILPPCHIRVR